MGNASGVLNPNGSEGVRFAGKRHDANPQAADAKSACPNRADCGMIRASIGTVREPLVPLRGQSACPFGCNSYLGEKKGVTKP